MKGPRWKRAAALAAVSVMVLGFAAGAGMLHDPSGPVEELYQDAILALIAPAMDEAIEAQYRRTLKSTPMYDFATTEFQSLHRTHGYRTGVFRVVLEVTPFLGPHIAVGRDRMCVEIRFGQAVEVVRFTHIEDYALPERYQNEYRGGPKNEKGLRFEGSSQL